MASFFSSSLALGNAGDEISVSGCREDNTQESSLLLDFGNHKTRFPVSGLRENRKKNRATLPSSGFRRRKENRNRRRQFFGLSWNQDIRRRKGTSEKKESAGMNQIPDVEGCKRDHCELTRTPYGWRFISEDLNSYIAFLFEIIVARGPSIGLNVSLNRYDLFHGHLFLATDSGRLGILFHSKEYPAHNEKTFPYNMGYCQTGSNLKYDNSINLRNILWLAPLPSDTTKAWVAPGVLVVLDARPGGIIYKDLVPEYVDLVRTIYEDEFGEVAVDVNYINLADTDAANKIFIC